MEAKYQNGNTSSIDVLDDNSKQTVNDELAEIIVPTLKLKRKQKVYLFFKSVMEWIISLLAFIFLLIPFLFVGIAIKCDSKGPVFFKQKRIGRKGKEFTCLKFRSMYIDTDPNSPTYKLENAEQHITKVGKFIRKTSIDELPQIINVLTGKMSLIGYRPLLKDDEEMNILRCKYNIYQIKPGITGWAQVNGRDILSFQPSKKAEYDFYYLRKVSFRLDFKIFFLTIKKIFKCEDVQEGKGTNEIKETDDIKQKLGVK